MAFNGGFQQLWFASRWIYVLPFIFGVLREFRDLKRVISVSTVSAVSHVNILNPFWLGGHFGG